MTNQLDSKTDYRLFFHQQYEKKNWKIRKNNQLSSSNHQQHIQEICKRAHKLDPDEKQWSIPNFNVNSFDCGKYQKPTNWQQLYKDSHCDHLTLESTGENGVMEWKENPDCECNFMCRQECETYKFNNNKSVIFTKSENVENEIIAHDLDFKSFIKLQEDQFDTTPTAVVPKIDNGVANEEDQINKFADIIKIVCDNAHSNDDVTTNYVCY